MKSARSLAILSSFEDALMPAAAGGIDPKCHSAGRAALRSLAALDRVTVAIHAGISLLEMAGQLMIPKCWYVATRGFEMRDPEGKGTQFFGPEDVRFLGKLYDQLLQQTDHVAGVRLSHRGPLIELDYRLVDPGQIPSVLDILRTVVASFSPQTTTVHRRGSVEVRIRSAFDERTAIRYVHRRIIAGSICFYFGSDPSIIEMLGELQPPGIVVHVGQGTETTAPYFLPGPDEVAAFLEWIHAQWSEKLRVSPGTDVE